MRNTFLEFEQPLAELENKIEQLRYVQADSAVDISDEIGRLQQKSQTLAKEIYAKLTPWQTALVARHPQRPYTLDYVREMFTDFHVSNPHVWGCRHPRDYWVDRPEVDAQTNDVWS
jgi:acetyl-CoA carboxylase carboxyl transferase subunit alpha